MNKNKALRTPISIKVIVRSINYSLTNGFLVIVSRNIGMAFASNAECNRAAPMATNKRTDAIRPRLPRPVALHRSKSSGSATIRVMLPHSSDSFPLGRTRRSARYLPRLRFNEAS